MHTEDEKAHICEQIAKGLEACQGQPGCEWLAKLPTGQALRDWLRSEMEKALIGTA